MTPSLQEYFTGKILILNGFQYYIEIINDNSVKFKGCREMKFNVFLGLLIFHKYENLISYDFLLKNYPELLI